jgi:hypothetical protein
MFGQMREIIRKISKDLQDNQALKEGFAKLGLLLWINTRE